MFITQCYTAAAQFPECRDKLFSLPNLIKDICRCLHFKNLPRLCLTTTDTVTAFAPAPSLQNALFESGVLCNLLYYMFNYDFTLEEGGVERSNDSNQQEISNRLAKSCIRACAALAGFHNGFNEGNQSENSSPTTDTHNNQVMNSLISLLTPYLARHINGEPSEMLKLMNSNTQNPTLIWDNSTRAELRDYLKHEREHLYKKGECADEFLGQRFKFSIFEKELSIGDIYVRIYNEMPTYPLENPKKICIDLLDFLGSHAQYLYSTLMNPTSMATGENAKPEFSTSIEKLKNIEIGLEALRNVIRHNDGVEIQCIGHFKLLFMLLRLGSVSSKLQTLTLEMLISVTTNKSCVNDIANADVLLSLLLVLHSFSAGQHLALDCLYALSSNNKIVKDMIHTGGLLYLLNIFANGLMPQTRKKSAELISKLLADKLTGPRIRLILQRFLPPLFMDAMKENAEAAVITYEGTYENPELIWNEEARQRVSDCLTRMSNNLFKRQVELEGGNEQKWNILEDLTEAGVHNVKEATATLYSSVSSDTEIVVSGVFIRLFISNPGWVLRKPKEFLVDLFELWSDTANRKMQQGQTLEQLTQALVQLFNAQPLLLENIPTMGTLPKVLQTLSAKNEAIVGYGIFVLNQIVKNENCLKSLTAYDCINIFKEAIKKRIDLIPVISETLCTIFSNQTVVDEFVGQVKIFNFVIFNENIITVLNFKSLKCDLIHFLLRLLESNLDKVDNPMSIKAQIVKAIKGMLNSTQYLSQVSKINLDF